MTFNYVSVTDPGFEEDIYVNAKCDFCGGFYPLSLIVSKQEALDKENFLGKQLEHNGYIHMEDCGDCWNHQEG